MRIEAYNKVNQIYNTSKVRNVKRQKKAVFKIS